VHLLRAVENDPEYIAARNNLAIVYMRMGNPDAAVSQLKVAGNSIHTGQYYSTISPSATKC
jgi:Tfp pilus assembly protein PilF